jgi:hypothetical protein
VVLEFGCDETENVRAPPFLVGIPEFGTIALLVVEPEQLLDFAHVRPQLGRLEVGRRAFRFLWDGGILMSDRR